MRIINPIYDVAFKYLMEDLDIARGLISKIIGEEITDLVMHPQEMQTKSKKYSLLILRLDFKATIKTKNGQYQTILIELQKAKEYDDLVRFRRYLGENYSKQVQVVTANGASEKKTLPITTIYILGFLLPGINTSVLWINRQYYDVIHKKKINVKSDFVEKLTHDSFVILVRQLPPKQRNELEGLLQVFNQNFQLDSDAKLMEIREEDLPKNELTNKILTRLQKGATDEEVLKQMIVEEEVEGRIDKHVREKEELTKQKNELAKQKNELAKQKDILKKEKKGLEGELKSKDEQLDKQRQIIEELKKRLEK